MAKKDHVSETPATALLKANRVAFTEHPYEYLEHGGAQRLYFVVETKSSLFTDDLRDKESAKSVEPCKPEVANRHSGYLVGGTSPFGTRRTMPVFIEESILALPKILINGGRRGYLVGIDPQVCVQVLGARPVQCALVE